MNIEKYNNYIDVQGTWFNKYPRTWNINRLKEILFNSSEQSKSIIQGEKYIELANVEGWTGNIINLNNNPEFESSVKNFKKGNVLFSKLRPYLAKSIIAPFNGVCVSEFLVFKPHLKINNKFLHYVLLSDKFIQTVNNSTYGSKMPRASWDFIKIQMMAYPELIIQNKIATFLDQKTTLIDKKLSILQERKKLILELEKSVINQVVTKGLQSFNLDKNGEKIDFNNDKGLSDTEFDDYMSECGYKDSGIEWVGYVHESFDVKVGKQVFEYEKNKNTGMKNNNNLSLTYKGVINRDINNNAGLKPNDYSTYQIVDKDDLIFKLIDLENRKTSRVGIVHERGIMSSAYIKLKNKNKNKYDSFYFYKQYFDLYLRGIYNQIGSNAVRSALTFGDLLDIKIIVPKTKTEQTNILKFINLKTSQFKKQVSNIDNEIELLKEFRKTVINDVVTGKIKVVV